MSSWLSRAKSRGAADEESPDHAFLTLASVVYTGVSTPSLQIVYGGDFKNVRSDPGPGCLLFGEGI